ncbi:FHA domain-containing protein [Phycicoccus flavus]|uniref:FHA domain-containing protein n=1 Tax=Phycicoccus flavus TaxID=2502783 RepID=A0A8T6R4U7_9MICO|nr:FHA domain-containing protein [Phycicoccus flavus]NHA68896.1 FHA domain-containing protein [Phycicoccus flavus]
MSRCPAGHDSRADDYCDVCGLAVPAAPADGTAAGPAAGGAPVAEAPAAGPGGAGGVACPHCGAPNAPDALFCEACGYDHTTGAMPRRTVPSPGPTPGSGPATGSGPVASPAPSLPGEWVAELWVDPAWYEGQSSPDPLPSPGPPAVVPLRSTSLLVGRASASRGIHPDVDCGADAGVSRRHAQLTTDGTRWWVEDLDSSNGTFVGDATGGLPTTPVPVGRKTEIGPDDRVYLGSWTRLVIRAAVPGELGDRPASVG